jgi:hypothetical protein
MRLVPLALLCVAASAQAEIVGGDKTPLPSKGIQVPKGKAPTHLECWLDGRRQVVEVSPAQLPPSVAQPSTRVVIKDSDGTTTVVVVPGAGASGCLPIR